MICASRLKTTGVVLDEAVTVTVEKGVKRVTWWMVVMLVVTTDVLVLLVVSIWMTRLGHTYTVGVKSTVTVSSGTEMKLLQNCVADENVWRNE